MGGGRGTDPASVPQALSMVPGLRRERRKRAKPILLLLLTKSTSNSLCGTCGMLLRIWAACARRKSLVYLDCSSEIWIYRPMSHKTEHHGRGRVILVGPLGQKILQPYLLRSPEIHCSRLLDSEAKRRSKRHASRRTPIRFGNRPGTNVAIRPKCTPSRVMTYRVIAERFIAPAIEHFRIQNWTQSNSVILASRSEWNCRNGKRTIAGIPMRSGTLLLRWCARIRIRGGPSYIGPRCGQHHEIYEEHDLKKGVEVARRIG